jgi:hypothetical protein
MGGASVAGEELLAPRWNESLLLATIETDQRSRFESVHVVAESHHGV